MASDDGNVEDIDLEGKLALVHGIQSKQELNGMVVTVLSFESTKQRYVVLGEGMPKPMLLQPRNLRLVTLGDQLPTATAQQLAGKRVVVEGLASKPAWNGKTGVLQHHCRESNRFAILLEGVDQPKMLQARNFRIQRTPRASELIGDGSALLQRLTTERPADVSGVLSSALQVSLEVESYRSRSKTNQCQVSDLLALDMPVFSNHGCPACLAAYMYVFAGTLDLIDLYYGREVLKSLSSMQSTALRRRAQKGPLPCAFAWRYKQDICRDAAGKQLYREWVSTVLIEEPKDRSPNFAALKNLLSEGSNAPDLVVGILLVAVGDYLSDSPAIGGSCDHEFCLIRLKGVLYIVDVFMTHPALRKDPRGLNGFWHRTGVPHVRCVNDVDAFVGSLQRFLNQPENPAALAGMYGIDNCYASDHEMLQAFKLANLVHQGQWTSTQTACFKDLFHVDFKEEFEAGAAEHAPLLVWRSRLIKQSEAQLRYDQLVRSGKTAEDLHTQHCRKAEERFSKLSAEERRREYIASTESVLLSGYSMDFD